jgi:hypothetical protein
MDDAAKRVEAVVDEMSAVDLGDGRLNFRGRMIARRLATRPGESFPKALATEAELEGFYRFLGNEKVTPEALLRPHLAATVERACEHGTVVAIHDTTEFEFHGEGREDLGVVTRDGNKLFAHFCLIVSADGRRDPLGAFATRTWVRDGKPTRTSLRKRGARKAEIEKLPSEYDRWQRGIDEAEAQLGGRASLIHVLDSEADEYCIVANFRAMKRRFVLRSCRTRRLAEGATGSLPGEKLPEFMARADVRAKRTVQLSRRKKHPRGIRTKRAEARDERGATLVFSAKPVTIHRSNRAPKDLADTVTVNVICVREENAPDDMVPVDWTLFTSEPIDTEEQILAIVDWYRARWTIEEFNKALKTGCAFEKRQLESKSTIDKALALFTPVAWALLRMRTASRSSEKTSILTVLSPTQIVILKDQTKIPLRKNSTAAEAYVAIARLGGHIKNNGAPGWQVIGRGYTELLTLEVGYKIAKNGSCDR